MSAATAIDLLDSMVRSGEVHTARTLEAVTAGRKDLQAQAATIKELTEVLEAVLGKLESVEGTVTILDQIALRAALAKAKGGDV